MTNARPESQELSSLAEQGAPRGELVGEPLVLTIRRVAVPAVIANLLMTAFHNVDTFWIGRSLGPEALAAVTGSIFWIWMVIAMGEMVSIGLDAIAARRHGERRPREAAQTVGEGLLLAFLLGSAIAIATPFVLRSLFVLLHTGETVSDVGRHYLGTYLLGMPFVFGFFAVDAAFRAKGDTTTPLLILAGTTALGLILDPVLIRGAGPVPALGVRGAALATLVPRGFGCFVGIALLSGRSMVRWAKPRLSVMASIVRVGAPASATGMAFSAIYVALTPITTQFGTSALAALGLGFRLESIIYVISVGTGLAVAAIVGQSLGAGDVRRAARAGWIATAMVSAVGLLMAILSFVFAEELVSIFTTDPGVIEEAAHYLHIAAFCQVFLGAEVVLESAMGGAGWTVVPMLLSTSVTALRLPLAAWASSNWGTAGLWWTLALTASARGLVMALLWGWGRWRLKHV